MFITPSGVSACYLREEKGMLQIDDFDQCQDQDQDWYESQRKEWDELVNCLEAEQILAQPLPNEIANGN